MIRTILDGGINWNWYLQGDFNAGDKTVHIYFYERWHKYEYRGSGHPANAEYVPGFKILETEAREVYGVRLDETEYLVTNPAYIFSYRDMTYYVSE